MPLKLEILFCISGGNRESSIQASYRESYKKKRRITLKNSKVPFYSYITILIKRKRNYKVWHVRAPWHGTPMPSLCLQFFYFVAGTSSLSLWHALLDLPCPSTSSSFWIGLGLHFGSFSPFTLQNTKFD